MRPGAYRPKLFLRKRQLALHPFGSTAHRQVQRIEWHAQACYLPRKHVWTMKTLSILPDPQKAIDAAIEVLADGGLVAMPTETVYGLAADATNGKAVAEIFAAKGRPTFNPLICHVSDLDMARRHVLLEPPALTLAEAFWPGPLTLVLPLLPSSNIHALTRAGLDTLAVRMPGGFARDLIGQFGRPLAAPSANPSGRISATRAEHVESDLAGKVDCILDGGPAAIGLESTIIKFDVGGAEVLRPGGLAIEDIETVLGSAVRRRDAGNAAIEAPGMMKSHYAPRTPIRLAVTKVNRGDAVISFGDQAIPGSDNACITFNLSPTGDLSEAAANLFDYMKRADNSGAATISVAPIPDTGLGEAINDRLARAAAPAE